MRRFGEPIARFGEPLGKTRSGGGGVVFTDDFARDDGAVGNGWSGGTIASGQLVVTPTLGSELLLNGDFETGDPPDNWTSANSATLSSEADPRTGSGGVACLQIENGTTDQGQANQNVNLSLNDWVVYSTWGRAGSHAGESHLTNITENLNSLMGWFVTTWASGQITARSTNTAITVRHKSLSSVLGATARFDDSSFKVVSDLASAFVTRQFQAGNGRAEIGITKATYTAAGVAHYVDASNFVTANFNNSGRVELLKRVGGTYTVVQAGVDVTYSAGAVLRLWREGQTYSVSYGGTEIISDKTIADAVFDTADKWGVFNIWAANRFDNFAYSSNPA